jgi:hypothetical protein
VPGPAPISLGTIILAPVREPIDRAPVDPHYAIVLSPQREIAAGLDLRVAVCTTSFRYPLLSGWFEMPTAPDGHPITGLREACVVKATWIDRVPQSAVMRVVGRSTTSIYKQVLNWLAERERQMGRSANP